LKKPITKKVWQCSSTGRNEHLPSKYEALSSNTKLPKRKKKEKKEET
jgi:hypothetical protein